MMELERAVGTASQTVAEPDWATYKSQLDASIVDKQHNKAIKDLLRPVFNDEICFSSEWGFDQEILQKPLDRESMDGTELLSVEDVLGVK
jgi:hypothetical protein